MYISKGLKGKFVFSSVIHNKINSNLVLEVVGDRNIKELVANKEDPLNTIYKPIGLTEIDYTKDLEDNVSIITFITPSEDYIYVPVNHIVESPSRNGIDYQVVILAANLGPLPLDYDLTLVKDTLKDSILTTTGIKTTVGMTEGSGIYNMDINDHELKMKRLQGRKTHTHSYKHLYEQALKDYRELYQKYMDLIEAMENTIT